MYFLGLGILLWIAVRSDRKRSRELDEWYNRHGIY
jgi:hypothetical protein